jgi:putative ABC transport system substrate-binding protein
MRRREFIRFIGCGCVVWPFVVQAQSASTKPHIAYLGALSPSTLDPRQIEQFKVGLNENGLIDGENIEVDYLWGEGSSERLHQIAIELTQRNLDLIVTAGPQPVRALRDAGVKAPIVFAILNDPVGDGFVQSLARPGGNITGLSMAGTDLEGKRLEILKEAVPTLKKVVLLHDPSMGSTGLDETKTAARRIDLDVLVVDSNDTDKIRAAFVAAVSQGVSGVATMASPFFNFHRKQLIELASEHRLASIWETGSYVRDGGLLAYGPSFPDMYRRSAGYVAKILSGAKPSDLPVQQPTQFELAVNTKTAQALGIVIPARLISRADEVIE